ncbi:uncharacterized protein LOC141913860 [Tubulanus polymorphus]|uniref:uncharacterized protein LOC141913860 n=1 Tax=Tubulanus polymorphus TaxID=672921 RepID=UPI003DA38A1E
MEQCMKIKSPDSKQWTFMAQLTLVRIAMFNKRRVSEVAEIKRHEINECQQTENREILQSLDKVEQALVKRMSLFEVRGKSTRGLRKAFILMTTDMVDSIEYLSNTNSNKLNPYLFARKSSRTPLDGCEAFRVVTNECPNLLEPGSIRTSALRRYLATTSQILDMKPEELKMLCDHMGHDVNIHINHYRLQSSLLEKSKVARLLIAVENGQVKDFKGKNLDDIEIDTLPLHSAQFDEAETSDTTSVVIRKRWSDEENTVFFNIMKDYIESKKMPPASKIREVCDKLKGRTTAQIRSRVHNYITGKQKFVV